MGSRNRRGVMTTEWAATSTWGYSSVLAAHETPGPNAGSPMPRWRTSRRVDVVVSQPRSTPPSPQLDVAGTLSEGLPQRFRDAADRSGHSDWTCGAPIFSPATTLNRGQRLRIHRGRAPASSTDRAERRRAVTEAGAACSDRPDQRRVRSRHPAKHRVGEAPAFADRTVPRALAPSVVCAVTVEVTPIRQLAVGQALDQRA